MTKALSTKDLQFISDEPRILDLRIAERLGFERAADIRELIERNTDELSSYGEVFRVQGKTGPKGGRPGMEYHLNEPQTLLLCMFSRTEKAAEVRREVISAYLTYRRDQIAVRVPAIEELEQAKAQIADLREKIDMQAELLQTRKMASLREKADMLFDAVVMLIRGGGISDEDIAKTFGLDIAQVQFARFRAEHP